VDIRPAHPNVIPVVTATWPRRLNHPVIQDAKAACFGGARRADQKYGPPLVGMEDTISAIPRATMKVKKETIIQPRDEILISQR
jgi:hypothetical protein